MKLLNSYKKIAKEFIKEAAWDRKFGEPLPTLSSVMKEAEVDDDKIVKYKDKEGESQEMTAGAAKKQPDDHPAKVAYNKMTDDGGDDKKDSGGKLGGSDFDRDGGDEPKDEPSSSDSSSDDLLPDGKPSDMDYDDAEEKALEIADYIAKKMNVSKEYAQEDAKEKLGDDPESWQAFSSQMVDSLHQLKQDPDGYQKYDESISINGQKYKAIKESKEPTKPTIHPFKETYKKIGGK